MSQSPVRRPTSNVEDFKARFGVAGAQRPSAEPQKHSEASHRTRPQRESRYPLGAIALSLLFGAVGAGAFFVAYDYKVFGSLFARSETSPPTTQSAAAKPAEPDSSVAKSSDSESPVFAEVPAPPKPAPAEPVEAPVEESIAPAAPSVVAETVAPEPVTPAPAASADAPAQVSETTSTQVEAVATDVAASPPVENAAQPGNATVAEAAPSTAVQLDTQVAVAPAVTPAPEVAPAPQPTPPAAEVAPAPEPVPAPAEAALETSVAVAAPVAVPEAVPAKRLLVVPSPEQLLVSGQVFRDCENCPDVVVVVPPARAISASDVQVMPRKEVTDLKPFALGRFEITFDDWAFCVTSGGCKEMPEDAGWGRNTRPVINVSHKMIEEQYLPWLASVTGKAYRLPTSAEWQYAESGADVGAPMLLDPLTLCQTGNFSATNAGQSGVVACNDGYSTTSPVGVHRPNTIGLHDMRGNVWEWVSDCWTPGFTYKAKPSELECRKRQVRGGSWSSRAELSPEAAKGFEDATRISKTIGFRIARDLP